MRGFVMPWFGDEVLPSKLKEKDGGLSAQDNVGGLVQEVLWEIDDDVNRVHVRDWVVLMQDGRLLPVVQLEGRYYISAYVFHNW